MPWSEESKNAARERRRALHADPEFKARRLASSPLAALTKEQREEYDILTKKGGYKRQEALAIISESAII